MVSPDAKPAMAKPCGVCRFWAHQVDITDPDHVAAVVKRIAADIGPDAVSILINNAGTEPGCEYECVWASACGVSVSLRCLYTWMSYCLVLLRDVSAKHPNLLKYSQLHRKLTLMWCACTVGFSLGRHRIRQGHPDADAVPSAPHVRGEHPVALPPHTGVPAGDAAPGPGRRRHHVLSHGIEGCVHSRGSTRRNRGRSCGSVAPLLISHNLSCSHSRCSRIAEPATTVSSPLSRGFVFYGAALCVSGGACLSDYSASKFAAAGFAESLRYELRRLGADSVRSLLVHPYATA